jgi:hypothetical protein
MNVFSEIPAQQPLLFLAPFGGKFLDKRARRRNRLYIRTAGTYLLSVP